jgi:hypothetical protein
VGSLTGSNISKWPFLGVVFRKQKKNSFEINFIDGLYLSSYIDHNCPRTYGWFHSSKCPTFSFD